jgi:phospholipid/cholesterol/gamma-HCH transport system ATP-binding protein
LSPPVVTLEEVSVFFGSKEALKSINLSLSMGEVKCILGPSGCGKTTTLRVIAGLQKIQKGRMKLFDSYVTPETEEKDLADFRKRLGVVFQGGALFDSLTVGQNIAFPLKYCRGIEDRAFIEKKVKEMLDHVELEDVRELYPSELSGGMRKRVAIARALVHEPEVLLLDEPTTGLDPLTARHIDALIVTLCRRFQVAVLVVTHDMVSALGIADRLVLMDDGRVVWRGTCDEWNKMDDPAVKRFAAGLISVRGGDLP